MTRPSIAHNLDWLHKGGRPSSNPVTRKLSAATANDALHHKKREVKLPPLSPLVQRLLDKGSEHDG